MVSAKTRAVVWARGAGRCHYCNVSLIGDLVSGTEDKHFGLIAHIVAEAPGGPRGDPIRSPQLADDPSNLMLMCHTHHKLIDDEPSWREYTEARLLEMKRAHEDRIQWLTDVKPERASHVLRYGANIGHQESLVSFDRARLAMLPDRYPADGRSIGIEILGSAAKDGEDLFWASEPTNLQRQFDTLVRPRIAQREITHMSVFALAPIPLLISLGRLLGDIVPADIYQLHREPSGWRWANDADPITYRLEESEKRSPIVALNLSISADVTDERITAVLGDDVAIWKLAADTPHNDIMRRADDLSAFRKMMRKAFADISRAHGNSAVVHIFPAIPVSVAVEVGRVWMPKADPPMAIYDQLPGIGFKHRLDIN